MPMNKRPEVIVFESETPPSITSSSFQSDIISCGAKVYVPDSAVNAYKTATNFTKCASVIYPVSQLTA